MYPETINPISMARFENGNLRGSIGKITFYVMGSKNYAKSKPGKRNKKRNAKPDRRQVRFGNASSLGTPIINHLKPYLLFHFKLNTYNDFRGWCCKELPEHDNDAVWDLSVADTALYNINRDADLRDQLLIMPEVLLMEDRKVKISFPSFVPAKKIKAPAKTQQVNIQLLAVSAPISDSRETCHIDTVDFTVDYNKQTVAAKEFLLETGQTAGNLLLIIIALVFITDRIKSTTYVPDVKFLPAAIVAAGIV